jgi:hypothetical protein
MLDRLVYRGFSWLCAKTDQRVIDPGLDAMGDNVIRTGRILSRLQSGMIQHRLLVVFAVVVLLALHALY